jgi:hypothetical protein
MPNHTYVAQAGQQLLQAAPDAQQVAAALTAGEGKKAKDAVAALVPYGPAVAEVVATSAGLTASAPFTAALHTPALVSGPAHTSLHRRPCFFAPYSFRSAFAALVGRWTGHAGCSELWRF